MYILAVYLWCGLTIHLNFRLGGRASTDTRSVVQFPAPPANVSMCPWAIYLTLNCSRWLCLWWAALVAAPTVNVRLSRVNVTRAKVLWVVWRLEKSGVSAVHFHHLNRCSCWRWRLFCLKVLQVIVSECYALCMCVQEYKHSNGIMCSAAGRSRVYSELY